MHFRSLTFFWLSAVLFIASCGVTPTSDETAIAVSFTPSQGKSLIYVYRPARLLGAAINSRVALDGRSKGELPNGKFMCLEVNQGPHELLAGGQSIRFNTKPGERRFFQVDVSSESQGYMIAGPVMTPILAFKFQAYQIDENEARKALHKTRQVAVKDAPIPTSITIIQE